MPEDEFSQLSNRLLAAYDFASQEAEREQRHRQEMMQLLSAVVEIVDSLDKICSQYADDAVTDQAPTSRKTIEVLRKKVLQELARSDCQPMNAVGQPLDLCRHHVSAVRLSASPEDTVLEEPVRGYLWRGQVLRPAKVIIAGSPEQSNSNPSVESKVQK